MMILKKMKEIIEKAKGSCPIYFHIKEGKDEKVIKAHSSFNVSHLMIL
jgi:hypothetical protein